MKTQLFAAIRPFSLALVLPCLVSAMATPPATAAANEDSLVCAKVKDSYAREAYVAAFWPRSSEYGDMSWCNMKVQAVEHCGREAGTHLAHHQRGGGDAGDRRAVERDLTLVEP